MSLQLFGSLDFRHIASGFSFRAPPPIGRVTNNELWLNDYGLVSGTRLGPQER